MVTNTKDYMNEYMKKYNVKNGYMVECSVCGLHIKKCNMYAHNRSKTHLRIQGIINRIHQPQ